jgi:hypothetical protein
MLMRQESRLDEFERILTVSSELNAYLTIANYSNMRITFLSRPVARNLAPA